MEKRGEVRPKEANTGCDIIGLRSDGEIGHKDEVIGSHVTSETISVRSRASVNALDEVTGWVPATRPEVPKDRLCRCVEPKHALAPRGPDNRLVPTFAGEQESIHVFGNAIIPRVDVANNPHEDWRSFNANLVATGEMSESSLSIRTTGISTIGTILLNWMQEVVRFTGRQPRLEADAGCARGKFGEQEKFALDIPSYNRKH